MANLTTAAREGNQVTFRNSKATVVVSVLAPDLIRVRMVSRTSVAPDHSYAVVKTDWPNVPIEVAGDKETRIIRTRELEVRAHLSPFRLAFYDRGGKLVAKDADTRGMSWNRPAPYHKTLCLSPKTSVTFRLSPVFLHRHVGTQT